MEITLQQIAQAIANYGAETDLPTFGSASIELASNNKIKVTKSEIVWGGYIDIFHPDFKYAIAFGEAQGGWSYNDDQGYGYCDFISHDTFTTPDAIAEEFFRQVYNNPQLIK